MRLMGLSMFCRGMTEKFRFWLNYGAWGKARGSPKLLEFILRGTLWFYQILWQSIQYMSRHFTKNYKCPPHVKSEACLASRIYRLGTMNVIVKLSSWEMDTWWITLYFDLLVAQYVKSGDHKTHWDSFILRTMDGWTKFHGSPPNSS